MRRPGILAGAGCAVRLAAVGVALALGLCPGVAGAVTAGGGYAVSPASSEVDVPAAQATVVTQLKLTNQTAQSQTFALSAVDFDALGDDGGVAFLGTPVGDIVHKYGLVSWLSLPESSVTVAGGSTVTLPITIENRADLAPGGHYGAVLATAENAAGQASGNSVGIKPVLSALLLVTKEGGLREDLTLVGQTSNASWWRLPGNVAQRYHNTGNVHLAPRGVVAVVDPHGTVVERAAINGGSGVILPETYRRYETDLMSVGKAWLPGRYRIVATYSFEGGTEMKSLTQTFWYVGALAVWAVAIAALLAVVGLGWWLWGRPRRRR